MHTRSFFAYFRIVSSGITVYQVTSRVSIVSAIAGLPMTTPLLFQLLPSPTPHQLPPPLPHLVVLVCVLLLVPCLGVINHFGFYPQGSSTALGMFLLMLVSEKVSRSSRDGQQYPRWVFRSCIRSCICSVSSSLLWHMAGPRLNAHTCNTYTCRMQSSSFGVT
jgi:hypothetical protein